MLGGGASGVSHGEVEGRQERAGHKATGQTRPTPQSITFTKRFDGVETTFILKQTLFVMSRMQNVPRV